MRTKTYVGGFLASVVLGLLLLWLRSRFAANPLVMVLAPMNNSAWEMSKLVFWPYLGGALVIWRGTAAGASRGGHCMLLLLMPLVTVLAGWLCHLGGSYLWAAVLAAGIALYAAVLRKKVWGGELLWYTLAILLGIAYILFSVLPPIGGPFTDPADVAAVATIPY